MSELDLLIQTVKETVASTRTVIEQTKQAAEHSKEIYAVLRDMIAKLATICTDLDHMARNAGEHDHNAHNNAVFIGGRLNDIRDEVALLAEDLKKIEFKCPAKTLRLGNLWFMGVVLFFLIFENLILLGHQLKLDLVTRFITFLGGVAR